MHEKVEHLFAQKTQRENKLPLPLLTLLHQILFNVNLRIQIFTSNIMNTSQILLTVRTLQRSVWNS